MTRPVLLHPIVLASIAILAANDHVWKRAAPGLITGKLSDVAGLLFFPALLAAAWGLARDGRAAAGNTVRVVLVASIATAIVFALVKTWPPAHLVYAWGLGAMQWPLAALRHAVAGTSLRAIVPVRLAMDASDLIALPFAFTVWVLVRRSTRVDP